MGLFDRFRKAKPTEAAPAAPKDGVELFDEQGNRIVIERAALHQVLIAKLSEAAEGQDGELLFQALLPVLQEQSLYEEALPAARRLVELDADRERAVTILAHVCNHTGYQDEAERLLLGLMEELGRTPNLVLNLAKVAQARGHLEQRDELLAEALAADPNLLQAVQWRGGIASEAGGEAAYQAVMEELAQLPGAFRPQLFLAKMWLEKGEIDQAKALYEKVLPLAVDDDSAMMSISGDLGQAGYEKTAVELVAPHFELEKHGPYVGRNLIEASYAAGDKETCLRLIGEVERANRHDFKARLEELRRALEVM